MAPFAGPYSNYIDIKGIPLRPGKELPVRTEVNNWVKNFEIQVSLFIRALQRMYDLPYDDPLSFFQIASIHGYPGGMQWNHGGPPLFKADDTDDVFIYCTHNSALFPSWHRPYMLLFEQAVFDSMLMVIDNMKFRMPGEKQIWIDEAYRWRLPYWDWALIASNGIPEIFRTKTIDIRVPKNKNGTDVDPDTVDNPLSRYQTRDPKTGDLTRMGQLPAPYSIMDDPVVKKGDPPLPWSQTYGTSRWAITGVPVATDQAKGINDWAKTNSAITQHAFYHKGGEKTSGIENHTVSELVYRLLDPGNVKFYKAFATTKYMKTPTEWTDYVNIEYIHNNLHNFIGGLDMKSGLGHMSDVPVAAYDPIFFFHHCNIDRQFAIWQALNPFDFEKPTENPERWLDPNDPDLKKDEVTGQSPLAPFRRLTDSGWEFWTSDACYDHRKLGYEYDGLWRDPNVPYELFRLQVQANLDEYQNTGKVVAQMTQRTAQVSALGLESVAEVTEEKFFDIEDFVVTVLYDRYALGGRPYSIHFFLATDKEITDEEINNSKLGAAFHSNYVASVHNFSAPVSFDEPSCPNCTVQAREGALSTALVPLTIPLYSIALDTTFDGLTAITPEQTVKYLVKGLQWKATDRTGNVVPWDQLPKTKIMVLEGKGRHYKAENEMSDYSGYKPLVEVTKDKDAGASSPAEYESPAESFVAA